MQIKAGVYGIWDICDEESFVMKDHHMILLSTDGGMNHFGSAQEPK